MEKMDKEQTSELKVGVAMMEQEGKETSLQIPPSELQELKIAEGTGGVDMGDDELGTPDELGVELGIREQEEDCTTLPEPQKEGAVPMEHKEKEASVVLIPSSELQRLKSAEDPACVDPAGMDMGDEQVETVDELGQKLGEREQEENDTTLGSLVQKLYDAPTEVERGIEVVPLFVGLEKKEENEGGTTSNTDRVLGRERQTHFVRWLYRHKTKGGRFGEKFKWTKAVHKEGERSWLQKLHDKVFLGDNRISKEWSSDKKGKRKVRDKPVRRCIFENFGTTEIYSRSRLVAMIKVKFLVRNIEKQTGGSAPEYLLQLRWERASDYRNMEQGGEEIQRKRKKRKTNNPSKRYGQQMGTIIFERELWTTKDVVAGPHLNEDGDEDVAGEEGSGERSLVRVMVRGCELGKVSAVHQKLNEKEKMGLDRSLGQELEGEVEREQYKGGVEMAKVVAAADNLVDEYRGGCFGAFKKPIIGCDCIKHWVGLGCGESVRNLLVEIYQKIKVRGEDVGKAHHRRYVVPDVTKRYSYLALGSLTNPTTGSAEWVELCEMAFFSFLARLPDKQEVKTVFRRLEEDFDEARTGRHRVMNRILYNAMVGEKISVMNTDQEAYATHLREGRESSSIKSTRLLANWSELWVKISKEMKESEAELIIEKNLVQKQISRKLAKHYERRNLSRIMICHEQAYMRDVKPRSAEDDPMTIKKLLDDVGGVVVTLEKEMVDFFQEWASIMPNEGKVLGIKTVNDTSSDLNYRMYKGNNLREGLITDSPQTVKTWAMGKQDEMEKFDKVIKDLTSLCMKKNNKKWVNKHMAYRVSHMLTGKQMAQSPHFDYPKKLRKDNYIAFWPFTKADQFLQIWPTRKKGGGCVAGELIHLPLGQILMVPGKTVHAGGFMASPCGHIRGHVYVYPNEKVIGMESETNFYCGSVQYGQNKFLEPATRTPRVRENYPGYAGDKKHIFQKKEAVRNESWPLGTHFFGVTYGEDGLPDVPGKLGREQMSMGGRGSMLSPSRRKKALERLPVLDEKVEEIGTVKGGSSEEKKRKWNEEDTKHPGGDGKNVGERRGARKREKTNKYGRWDEEE
jgi:hypothetical protein